MQPVTTRCQCCNACKAILLNDFLFFLPQFCLSLFHVPLLHSSSPLHLFFSLSKSSSFFSFHVILLSSHLLLLSFPLQSFILIYSFISLPHIFFPKQLLLHFLSSILSCVSFYFHQLNFSLLFFTFLLLVLSNPLPSSSLFLPLSTFFSSNSPVCVSPPFISYILSFAFPIIFHLFFPHSPPAVSAYVHILTTYPSTVFFPIVSSTPILVTFFSCSPPLHFP